jgi:SNF2 family DNA or RNA helicase
MKEFIPRPYQEIAIPYLIENERCALWLPPGMGKTSTTLQAVSNLSLIEKDIYPALILAPLRVASYTWTDEKEKWENFKHLSISTIVGNEDERRISLRKKANFYTCNYENISWLINLLKDDFPFKTVIADESIKLKNFRSKQGGKRAQSLGTVAWSKVIRFIELTGRPSPNGLKDLWGQLYYLDKGKRLGATYDAFLRRWFQRSWDGYGVEPLPFAQEQIQDKVKDICMSLDPKDWFDIKDPIIINIYIDLPPEARKLYNAMEKKMYMEIEGCPVEAFNAAARTNKCLQIVNGAAYLDHNINDDNHPKAKEWKIIHNCKLEAIENIINELGGAAHLISYNFKSDLIRLKKYFPKGRHFDANPKVKKEFISGEIDELFVHPGSAGHGVDGLQEVCYILINMAHDWNLDNYEQLIERIGPVRQIQSGFDRNVYIYNIIARNTMDEDVIRRRESKKSVQDTLLEAVKYREVAK